MKILNIPPHVMTKLHTWRGWGPSEVTGFFVSSKENVLDIIDAELVRAACSSVSVDITSEELLEFYQRMAEKGIYPSQLRVWWHTHPKMTADPSHIDFDTFDELNQDRALGVMYILGEDHETCHLSIRDKETGLESIEEIKISHQSVNSSWQLDYESLKKDYEEYVTMVKPFISKTALNDLPIFSTIDDFYEEEHNIRGLGYEW